jgi:hypothetical protein
MSTLPRTLAAVTLATDSSSGEVASGVATYRYLTGSHFPERRSLLVLRRGFANVETGSNRAAESKSFWRILKLNFRRQRPEEFPESPGGDGFHS